MAGLNAFMGAGPEVWQALRHALFALLSSQATAETQAAVQACLLQQISQQIHAARLYAWT